MTTTDFLYIFSVAGLLMALHSARNLALAWQSRHWPSTDGKLEDIDIRRVTVVDEPHRHRTWVSEHLFGRYTYEVGGRRYHGRRITLSDHVVKPRSELQEIIRQYSTRGVCTVYYNPEKPQQACLIPGPRLWNYTPFLTALGFIAFPFVFRSLAS